MTNWTVAEWSKLTLGEGEGRIPSAVAARLAASAAASHLAGDGGENVLEHGRNHLRARQFVGVIAAGGDALEILPKIDSLGNVETEEGRGRLRERLVHMLAVALDLDIAAGSLTGLGWQKENLLEILMRFFADKLMDAVRLGLPRHYVAHEDDLRALRGRMNVKRQFSLLAASPQRLACRYDEFSPDTSLNRIMKAAVNRLQRLTRRMETQRRLNELAFVYAEVSSMPRQSLRWSDVVLDRTNVRWRELLNLALLILGDRFQTTSLGDSQGFSLLFDMNELFEAYVAVMLKRALAGTECKVVSQGGRSFCLETIEEEGAAGSKRFQTKPDILIKRAGRIELIIDTKWKRLSSHLEDRKRGVSQADIYQMMAYGRIYGCSRLMLLYPHHQQLGLGEGLLARHRILGTEDRLDLATTDVADGTNLTSRLRAIEPITELLTI